MAFSKKIPAKQKNNYPMPQGIDADTAHWLKSDVYPLGPYRDESLCNTVELQHLRWFYESAPESRSDIFYPKKEGMARRKWNKMKRLIPPVNLLRPCVTTFVSAVYNGNTVRNIVANSYRERLQEWVNGPDYEQAVTRWAANAILYGVALAVPQVADDGELSIYLPDPCGTYIWTDPLNIRKITKVAEVTECSIRYFTLAGYGVLTKDAQHHVACNYSRTDENGTETGYLPVAYAAGEDCRDTGRIYSVSLCRDALHWSVAVGDSIFKARQLQAKETTSKLVIEGVDDLDLAGAPSDETAQQTEDREDTEVIKLPAGAKAYFIAPTPQIQASIDLSRTFIGQLCTAISIPADALDANYSMTGSGGSAEAARIRAIPLLNKSKFLCKQWAAYESDLVLALTAQLEYSESKAPISLTDLRKRSKTQITFDPYILPQSPNEVATTAIALLGAGLISPEEAIRRVTNNLLPEQVENQVKDVQQVRDSAGSAAAVADNTFKKSATHMDAVQKPAA